jgi:hypothetical protein
MTAVESAVPFRSTHKSDGLSIQAVRFDLQG